MFLFEISGDRALFFDESKPSNSFSSKIIFEKYCNYPDRSFIIFNNFYAVSESVNWDIFIIKPANSIWWVGLNNDVLLLVT